MARSTVAGLWKQGWNEIPEVMGSGIFFVTGFTGLCFWAYNYTQKENKTHRYKNTYTIMRPDDRRVDRLWRYEDSPAFTSTRK